MNATTDRTFAIRQPRGAETLTTPSVTMRLLIDSNEASGAVSHLEITMDKGADGATWEQAGRLSYRNSCRTPSAPPPAAPRES